jgi:hypothetical protein
MPLNPPLVRIQPTIRFAGAALIVCALGQMVPAHLLPALAQDLPPPKQGPEAPTADDLQERVRSLERTVEDMKKERGAPNVGDRPVSPEMGPARPTAAFTEPEEGRRVNDELAQGKSESPRGFARDCDSGSDSDCRPGVARRRAETQHRRHLR